MREELVHISTSSTTMQNMHGDGVQIANGEGGLIQLFFINAGSHFRIDNFHFDTSCYNLFVINDNLENHGTFIVPFDECLKHSSADVFPEGIISNALLERIFKYPSLIANPNMAHLTATDEQKVAVCKVHDYEVVSGGIKFKYVISKEFKQQLINEAPIPFGIMASDQTNELDHTHWEIKSINLLELLKLGGQG